jgi:hypothetical protein
MRLSFLPWIAASLGLLSATAAPDARFALVGTGGKPLAQKLGVPYYALEGNYGASGSTFSSVDSLNDPPAGHKVLRKVAKLNVRNDGLGQSNAEFEAALGAFTQSLVAWHSQRQGPRPVFAWYNPNAAAVAMAESLQIIRTIRREKTRNPAVTGTVWEIGNEPNLFPAILPADYAAIYARYHRIIKREDPSAQVAIGPVFVREVAMDLLPRLHESLTQGLIQRGVGSPGQPLFDSVDADLWKTVSSRTLSLGTGDYFAQVMAAIDTSIRPDIVSLHVYPYEDRTPVLGDADRKRILDSLADTLSARMLRRGIAAPLWITEFGNVNPSLNDEQAAAQASALIDVFTANAKFQKWFYYKGTGSDQQLAGLPGIAAPLTRLVKDSAFNPVDGNFPCGRLNAIGRMYYLRATGAACGEALGFATDTSVFSHSDVIYPQPTIRVRLGRAEVDTVRVNIAFKSGNMQPGVDFDLSPATAVFAPGDTSKTVTLTWKTYVNGTYSMVLALRGAANASLGEDSLHFVRRSVSVLSLGAGARPASFHVAGSRLRIFSPEAVDVRLRVYDVSGNLRGTVLRSLPAGASDVSLEEAFGRSNLRAGLYFLEARIDGQAETTFHSWMRE